MNTTLLKTKKTTTATTKAWMVWQVMHTKSNVSLYRELIPSFPALPLVLRCSHSLWQKCITADGRSAELPAAPWEVGHLERSWEPAWPPLQATYFCDYIADLSQQIQHIVIIVNINSSFVRDLCNYPGSFWSALPPLLILSILIVQRMVWRKTGIKKLYTCLYIYNLR